MTNEARYAVELADDEGFKEDLALVLSDLDDGTPEPGLTVDEFKKRYLL